MGKNLGSNTQLYMGDLSFFHAESFVCMEECYWCSLSPTTVGSLSLSSAIAVAALLVCILYTWLQGITLHVYVPLALDLPPILMLSCD